jgi:hypothetical protein
VAEAVVTAAPKADQFASGSTTQVLLGRTSSGPQRNPFMIYGGVATDKHLRGLP